MLTHERLLQTLSYDAETGVFIRRSTGRRVGVGKSDYGTISIDGKTYKAHRLAWRGGKYRAQISIDGSTKRIGSFPTAEEAHAAYVAEATRLFGEFARAA